METNSIVDQGNVEPDGTRVEAKATPHPSEVRVPWQGLTLEPPDHPFWQMMRRIWADAEKAGLKSRSVEVVEADRKRYRDEIDEEIAEVGRLQDECRQSRDEAERRSEEEQ